MGLADILAGIDATKAAPVETKVAAPTTPVEAPAKPPELDVAEAMRSELERGFSGRDRVTRLEGYHASEMYYACPREAAFMRWMSQQGAVWAKVKEPRRELTFKIGHLVHEDFQERIYGLGCMPGSVFKTPEGSRAETRLALPWGSGVSLVGSVDDLVEIAETKEMVGVEVKTIADKYFIPLSRPSDAHLFQVHTYLYMLEKTWVDSKIERFIMVYVSKQEPTELPGFPVKCFVVNKDAEYEKTVDTLKKRLDSTAEWYKAGQPDVLSAYPPGRCRKKGSSRESTCLFGEICFNDRASEKGRLTDLAGIWVAFFAGAKHGDIDCKRTIKNSPFLDWI